MQKSRVINLKKLGSDIKRRDFMFILYNEYMLDSHYTTEPHELKVDIDEDGDEDKLKRALKKYGAESEYIDSVFESKKTENKFKYLIMKKRFNSVNESVSDAQMDKLFVLGFNSAVSSGEWDESDVDEDYLFGTKYGAIEVLMDEIEEETGIEFKDYAEFYSMVEANEDSLDHPKMVEMILANPDYSDFVADEEPVDEPDDEDGDFSGDVDESYCYAKIEDVINEAREEGRREALEELNEAKKEHWFDNYKYEKPEGISPRDWTMLGQNVIDWKAGEREENIAACSDDKLKKYYEICKAVKFAKGARAIEKEAKKRDLELNESNEVIYEYEMEVNEAKKECKPLTKEAMKVKKEDLRAAKAEFAAKVKELKEIVKSKKIKDLVAFGEEFDAAALKAACKEWLDEQDKEIKARKPEVTAIINALNKINNTICVLCDVIECGVKKEGVNESVMSRFAKDREIWKKLNEEEQAEADKVEEEDEEQPAEDADSKEEEKPEEKPEEDKESDEKADKDADEEEEEIDIPAVIITVKKDDVDKCKEDMIDAGVAEDDIEVLDSEDEESDEVEIKVDTNSILELKEYLDKKGIDLEEKLGIEIQAEDDEDEKDEKKEDSEDKDSEDGEDEDLGLDDDFFASLGSIGEEGEEEKKDDEKKEE